MEINNELRRTKMKLAMFHDTEALNWLLFDLIDLVVTRFAGTGTSAELQEESKIWFIDKLKKDYKKYIDENSPKDKKQQKLF